MFNSAHNRASVNRLTQQENKYDSSSPSYSMYFQVSFQSQNKTEEASNEVLAMPWL